MRNGLTLRTRVRLRESKIDDSLITVSIISGRADTLGPMAQLRGAAYARIRPKRRRPAGAHRGPNRTHRHFADVGRKIKLLGHLAHSFVIFGRVARGQQPA